MREYQDGFKVTGEHITISDESGFHKLLPIVSGLQTFLMPHEEIGWSDIPTEKWREMAETYWKKSPRTKPRITKDTEMARIRMAIGISQVELAQTLGVYRSAISKWECGVRPIPGDVLTKLHAIGGRR